MSLLSARARKPVPRSTYCAIIQALILPIAVTDDCRSRPIFPGPFSGCADVLELIWFHRCPPIAPAGGHLDKFPPEEHALIFFL